LLTRQSPFSRDCLQRPYECLISTLKKMPWYKTELITVRQRYSVFRACLELVRLLQKSIRDRRHNDLNGMLLKRLVTAGMLCPGFTVLMKDSIAYQAGLTDMDIRSFNQPRFANMWVHQYALAPKPDTPLDMLEVSWAPPRGSATLTVSVVHRHHPRGDDSPGSRIAP